jgi:hypothetical protein
MFDYVYVCLQHFSSFFDQMYVLANGSRERIGQLASRASPISA